MAPALDFVVQDVTSRQGGKGGELAPRTTFSYAILGPGANYRLERKTVYSPVLKGLPSKQQAQWFL